MDKNSFLELNKKESNSGVLKEFLRNGDQQLIHQAVQVEKSKYLSQHQCFTDDGRVVLVSKVPSNRKDNCTVSYSVYHQDRNLIFHFTDN